MRSRGLNTYCWFTHSWGNWIGQDSQLCLVRRCRDCWAEEVKPDLERIKYYEDNSISFEEFMKGLNKMAKVNNKTTSTIDAQKDLKKANNLLNDTQIKKKLKKDKNVVKPLVDGTVNDLYKEVDEVNEEFNTKLSEFNKTTNQRFDELRKSLDTLYLLFYVFAGASVVISLLVNLYNWF